MCTPALREFKRKNPSRQIHFYTRYESLIERLSYIDSVHHVSACPSDALWLNYDHAVYKKRHFSEAIGDMLGVVVTDVRPDCYVNKDLVSEYQRTWNRLPRPYILVQRQASAWTPNRNWPGEFWDELIPMLLGACTVIEIGTDFSLNVYKGSKNYVDLRNVSVSEMVASIAAADVLVGPDSGPIHVAAAVGTSAVVVLGGYLLPENTSYPGNVVFHSPLPCSPCFLRDLCPHDLECLRQISPDMVFGAVMDMSRRSLGPREDILCTSAMPPKTS
jgi:ADP-heptose:LPS heptosyltransferase